MMRALEKTAMVPVWWRQGETWGNTMFLMSMSSVCVQLVLLFIEWSAFSNPAWTWTLGLDLGLGFWT